MEGEVCVSADERVYNMGTGELIFHKPMEFHKFTVTGPQGARLLIFFYSAQGDLMEGLRNKVFRLCGESLQLVDALLKYVQRKPAPDPCHTEESSYLQPFQQDPYYSQMVTTYLYQLLLCVAEEGTIAKASSAPDAVKFRRAISFLNCNLDRQPSVGEISQYCSISEASLKRLFEKYAGISVHKYLIKLKMKIAMELLQDHERVAVVAEKQGFASQSYFSKAFKKEVGINPSDVVRDKQQ